MHLPKERIRHHHHHRRYRFCDGSSSKYLAPLTRLSFPLSLVFASRKHSVKAVMMFPAWIDGWMSSHVHCAGTQKQALAGDQTNTSSLHHCYRTFFACMWLVFKNLSFWWGFFWRYAEKGTSRSAGKWTEKEHIHPPAKRATLYQNRGRGPDLHLHTNHPIQEQQVHCFFALRSVNGCFHSHLVFGAPKMSTMCLLLKRYGPLKPLLGAIFNSRCRCYYFPRRSTKHLPLSEGQRRIKCYDAAANSLSVTTYQERGPGARAANERTLDHNGDSNVAVASIEDKYMALCVPTKPNGTYSSSWPTSSWK
ncbi:hypothetical protein BDD12DRAFT_106789 [Trichophaea hybrida]|nr:hypothetical protein BDD12DRAFT_106789 [Trichophaea hybrida]